MKWLIIAAAVAAMLIFCTRRSKKGHTASNSRNDVGTASVIFSDPRYVEFANANNEGDRLEKLGQTSTAIEVYERAAAAGTDTPFTYRRLAILYKKLGKHEDEVRVCKLAQRNIDEKNHHRQWFVERLDKINKKHLKERT